MIKPVVVRGVAIGEGIPKICVPIVGNTREEILAAAEECKKLPLDVVEWRADWYDQVLELEETLETARQLRTVLGEIPLLFTFRTKKEGGEKTIAAQEYEKLNIQVAESGYVDLVDVEAFTGDEEVTRMIAGIHKAGVKVVASNHDFDQTPKKDEIVRRLMKMQEMGADIPKLAAMPTCRRDVLTLLDATLTMQEMHADRPIITMSMAGTGVISRLAGETFGSALTFGAAKKASAPGQIGVEDLAWILKKLHA